MFHFTCGPTDTVMRMDPQIQIIVDLGLDLRFPLLN